MARAHAEAVEAHARRLGLPDTRGLKTTYAESVENRTPAFEAEIAVSLYTGLPWNPIVGLNDSADVGGDVEVKWSPLGRLLIPEDADTRRRYVHARGRHPELELVGWIHGDEARERGRRYDANGREPCYLVDSERLRPMDTLEPLRSEILECPECGDEFEVFGDLELAGGRCIRCLDPRHAVSP